MSKLKILVFGLPGSGKSTLAEPLANFLNGVWLNADKIREEYDDWDFSLEGRIRQAMRMRFLSDGVIKANKIAVADFICPTEKARKEFGADYTIFLNTIKEGRYEDTNAIFERPSHVDYEINEWSKDTSEKIGRIIYGLQKN